MGLKLAVRTRVVVNRKEYHGVEEMPPEVRTVYEKVMASGTLARPGAAPGAATAPAASVIVFNGQSYDSPDAMPPEVRRLYAAALASLQASQAQECVSQGSQPAASAAMPALPHEAPDSAIEPSGASRWTFVAFLGGVGLLILWYLLRGRG